MRGRNCQESNDLGIACCVQLEEFATPWEREYEIKKDCVRERNQTVAFTDLSHYPFLHTVSPFGTVNLFCQVSILEHSEVNSFLFPFPFPLTYSPFFYSIFLSISPEFHPKTSFAASPLLCHSRSIALITLLNFSSSFPLVLSLLYFRHSLLLFSFIYSVRDFAHDNCLFSHLSFSFPPKSFIHSLKAHYLLFFFSPLTITTLNFQCQCRQ